jgi:PAS domain S-box-containing protein
MNAPQEPLTGVAERATPHSADDVLARTTAAALAVSSVEGPGLFADLAQRLAAILKVDATLIAVFSDASHTRLHTLAAWLDGRALRNFEYELATTPCRAVVGRESRFVGRGVHHEFGADTMFAVKGFDSYAAHSMMSSSGEQLGMVVALDRGAMVDQQLTEALLKIFAARAAAEVERSRAEQSYRAIFDAAEHVVFVHDWDTNAFVDVSAKAFDMYGYRPEELRWMRVADISAGTAPYTEADALAHIERAKRADAPHRFEWLARHRDGRLLWNEVTLKRAEIGGQRRVLAFVRDITDRKTAEQALQMREQQYRAIFDGSADAMVLWDEDLRIVDVNRTFIAIYGFARDEVIGTRFGELVPTVDVEPRLLRLRRALQGEEQQLEISANHKDGSRFDVELRYLPIQHLGAPHVLAIARDITQRRAAEAALRDSEAQYRGIFAASADALVLWNSDHQIVDVNPAYERIYRLRREDVVGGRYPINLPPAYVAGRLELVSRALAGEVCEVHGEAYRGDGSRFEVELRVLPIQHRGRPHALAIARDITERKRAEDALRDSEEQHRTIFNASVDGMLVKDAGNIVVDVNDAFLRMHGFAREELVGQCLLEFLPPELRTRCLELLPAVLAGTPCHFETQTWRRDRSVLDVEVHGVPVVYGGQARALVVMRDITGRKRSEAALRSSEAQYRAIFDVSADALMLWDSQLKRVDVNPAHQKIFGYHRDEVVGRSFEGLDYPADMAQERLDRVRRALAGEASQAEVEAQRKGGARIVTELRTIPFMHRGEPHVLQIARDVTEQKRAEAALRDSESQYRAIFEVSADALLLWDAEYRVVDVNPAYERFYGKRRDEVIGQNLAELLPPALVEQRRAMVQRALEGATVEVQTVGHRRGGGSFELELRLMPFLHRGERHVLAIGRDITEAKRAEDALRSSEARYRLLFDTESDALVLVDVQTLRLVDVNQAAAALYGRSRAELLQLTAPDLSAEPEETRRSIQQGTGPLDIPGRIHRDRTGRTFPVEIKANRLVLDGRMTVVAAIRDISERQQLEAQLRQAQKMEAIGQLAGGIAHDFNNILTSILGYVVLAQERAADAGDARSEAHLEQAMASCRRARDLVQQLLTFARGQRAQPAALDLCGLVRDAVPLLRASIPSTIELQYDCGAALPPARADRVQIDQVLLNLVLNARDALGAAGRGRIAVSVTLREVRSVCSSCRQRVDGRFIELAVTDDGPGMESSLADRVFEPFFSTKPPGPNSGMGLAMVHGIVHDHGGHVVLQTALGGGASFRVLLPLADGPAQAHGQPALAASGRPSRKRLQGRVLVVDDEPSVRDFLAELLRGWGLEVALAVNGDDGLERILAQRFDLVLSDQTMPGLDGLSLAHALTTLPDPPPLVLMSGLAGTMQAPLQAAGVRALLAKPLEPATLFDELRRHLQPE